MSSLTHGAGYLIIDHRESPGLTPADVAGVPGAVPVGKGEAFEADVLTCAHCERAILLNPARQRPRAYCPKCDAYICDLCEGVRVQQGVCRPMAQTLDLAYDLAVQGLPTGPAAPVPSQLLA